MLVVGLARNYRRVAIMGRLLHRKYYVWASGWVTYVFVVVRLDYIRQKTQEQTFNDIPDVVTRESSYIWLCCQRIYVGYRHSGDGVPMFL